jgi:hypothetical protein
MNTHEIFVGIRCLRRPGATSIQSKLAEGIHLYAEIEAANTGGTPVTIDLDALLQPIELAETMTAKRSAMWASLRTVKAHFRAMDQEDWDWTAIHAVLQVVDACAWAEGIPEYWRAHAIGGAASHLKRLATDPDLPIIAAEVFA